MPPPLHVFGIRHHGPGSARALGDALANLKPERILIEGPADADGVLEWAAHAEMVPPVAILVYDAADPKNAVYYPFARFSPEWVALRFAVEAKTPVRFMDLPQSIRLADEESDRPIRHRDPIGELAAAAGYDDGERWWEHVVEHRRGEPAAIFDAIREAMAQLRDGAEIDDDPRREAWMRKTIRETMKEATGPIAVVCGAWHTPVLTAEVIGKTKKDDDAVLKGVSKLKTVATWVPWTYDRLTFASGYGAGVRSPGWYDHLWDAPADVVERWMTRIAHLLREKDLDASSAHVIEATRLARGLAGMRGRAMADLADISDATRAVFCHDSDLPMRLIGSDLLVGRRLGDVPDDTPMIPLQQDVQKEQKRLRIKPDALEKRLELDLRTPIDLERSHFLHRLRLLGVPWGEIREARGKGTFKEHWALRWQPEFIVTIVEKGGLGNSVVAATAATVAKTATDSNDLPALAALVNDVLLADLPDAVDALLNRLNSVAAVVSDVTALMDAAGPLASVRRYGSVRQTDADLVNRTLDGLLPRIAIGLPPACASLDDAAAEAMIGRIAATDEAITLVESAEHTAAWRTSLASIAAADRVHGLVRGRAARHLFDAGTLSSDDVGTQMGLTLSPGTDLAMAAAWLEGFFRGSGLLLLHDEKLLALVDAWVTAVPADRFDEFVPLVRRTFSTFPAPERKQIGSALAKKGGGAKSVTTTVDSLDRERAKRALPLLRKLLGK
jgi:hypothetical protein